MTLLAPLDLNSPYLRTSEIRLIIIIIIIIIINNNNNVDPEGENVDLHLKLKMTFVMENNCNLAYLSFPVFVSPTKQKLD